ncbi:PulJ/GspJ family protein [Paraherbaspirillum soli]|uniref:Type II secretion system protein J n=1 Tax=Paraherbaspirillum soli TaxID=631222 RepID=A0ABW0M2P6_9BURK
MRPRAILVSSARQPKPAAARGFTLVELIIAITILALVAVLGWRGLDSIVRARVALTSELEQTRGMQLTFAQLQSDCAQIAPDTLIPKHVSLLATQDRLLMVRQVFAEQQPTRVQVVSYRLRDGVLTRRESAATRDLRTLDGMWQAALNDADNDPANTPAVVLQSDIARMRMRLWAKDQPGWRPTGVDAAGAADADGGAGDTSTVWTGLELSLQPRGRDGSMVKAFLLGAA